MSLETKTYLAREFRKKPTISEKIIWEKLRNRKFLGLKFYRQCVIDGYIVDFYCHSLKLVIEIDGSAHSKQIDEDKYRQKIIEEENIKFFRLTSDEVENSINTTLVKLECFINDLVPGPSPTGEGNGVRAKIT